MGLGLLALASASCQAFKPHRHATESSSAPIPKPPAPAPAPAATAEPKVVPAPECPSGMALIPGGPFWVGADRKEHFSEDEGPRFRTLVAPFCLDETEVTVRAFSACVAAGVCQPTATSRSLCQINHKDHGDYPMNCVTWTQADQFCAFKHARLPSEVEWEFAARGGEQYLKYPWGEASPDDHACWKQGTPCRVKSYAPGAFGLYDISGNVWEWTDDWYGPYPWPPLTGFSKVYRGGSFSRRFEKWMHTRLRDRGKIDFFGSHLGLRCASLPADTDCPFGWEEEHRRCLHGVTECNCPRGHDWNGVRCVRPKWGRCKPGFVEQKGHGCVLPPPPETKKSDDPKRERDAATLARSKSLEADAESEAPNVVGTPSPEFDSDCQANFRDRPHAFRYVGGTHRARTLVAGKAGCKNRDVGVGWNSSCCP